MREREREREKVLGLREQPLRKEGPRLPWALGDLAGGGLGRWTLNKKGERETREEREVRERGRKRKRGAVAPLSPCTGGQVGPLAAYGRRRAAGGAHARGGAGHPKEEGEK